ncbi:SMP-30/gluconolactonase/LRE family protein [uncultured Deinococcus sp.]|uniref:SMP-30/gluconolactonase/LRE family protein n=1 Tax=uncultured Deinococcus sp. TaxID=158789 RepID=UPI00258C3C4D|nr:SMP-30/gluconolactonase/LRE family protein [uncultured Deinococcus sp.]
MSLHATRPEFLDLFPEDAAPRQLAGGFTWTEGPTYVPARQAVFFSDVRQNRLLRWSDGGELADEMNPSHHQNGHCVDLQGRLIACSHGLRAIVRQEEDGSWTTLTDRFGGGRLNSPNDVTLHPDGSLWFSDPTYGIDKPEEGYGGTKEQPGNYVYRLDPDGTLSAPIRDRVKPNGLVFVSPERLILSDTGDAQTHAYRLAPAPQDEPGLTWSGPGGQPQAATHERVWFKVEPGKTDGIRVDEQGRLWSSAGDGVHVLTPDGEEIGRVVLPGTVTNLCFGGPQGSTLFMTTGSGFWSIETRTRALHLTL